MRDSGFVGEDTAPIVLIEFSDFQCPFCGRFSREVLPQLRTKYLTPGKVQLVFKHLPLEAIHPVARFAAEAAACASQIGKFPAVHDALFDLFSSRRGVTESEASAKVLSAGMTEAQLSRCSAGDGREMVQRDLDLAKSLSVHSTPTFFVGRRRTDGSATVTDVLDGSRPLSDFEAAFDRLHK
jgi:protein-disulfide isomerase